MGEIKVYVAGSWKNMSTIKQLMEKIEDWGYTVIVDWTKHQEKGGAKQIKNVYLSEQDCILSLVI